MITKLTNKRYIWILSLLLAALMTFSACVTNTADSTQGVSSEEKENMPRPYLGAVSIEIITVDGLEFKDLDKDTLLSPYEDWRLSPEERADDLLSRMTANEKAAQMLHITLVTMRESWFNDTNVGFALAYTSLGEGPEYAAKATNQLQEWSEASRLGIPVIISMDSVIGASWVDGATIYPDQITLAATRNVDLVHELNDIQRQEMLAMGVRMSLSPVADISTDPRWGRNMETFGENVELVVPMVVAAIEGLQAGNELTPASIMTSVKHFPGSGSQTAGVDGTPLVYEDDTFETHLSVFVAAIEAGAASIMPYGYSTVPYLGGDAAENYAHESSVVMTDLLRDELGYEGIIQTDWGLNHTHAALAGADVLGGAGQREIARLVENLSDEILDNRVRRILVAKFKMGLFENPYVNVENAVGIVGNQEHLDVAYRAAIEAMTLLKYGNITGLAGQNLIVAGSLAEDMNALSSGWKISNYTGINILEALQEKAGEDNVVYIGDDISAVKTSYPEGTTAIVIVGEKSGTHEPSWGSSTLLFPDEQTEMVEALSGAGIPVITVVLMGRPYVMTKIVEMSDTVLVPYRPGVSMGAKAIADTLFGEHPISGKLPFQIPRSMEQVLLQREDLAMDINDPLFEYGFGIEIDSLGNDGGN